MVTVPRIRSPGGPISPHRFPLLPFSYCDPGDDSSKLSLEVGVDQAVRRW